MLFSIHRAELLPQFSLHLTNQQGSPCCHKFLTITYIYHSKVTPTSTFHAEKIAEVNLLYVFSRPGRSQGPLYKHLRD